MGTVADKLNKVLQTKNSIKEAIISKGVNVADTDTFDSYAQKINNISTSTGSSSSVLTACSFWIDGQCNTRQGKNHSKTSLENLCWQDTGQATTGNQEILNTNGNTWDGDFLTLGNYAFYPYVYNSKELTVEAYIKISKEITSPVMVLGSATAGGWYLSIEATSNVRFACRLNSSYIIIHANGELEVEKPYYIVCTYKNNDKITLNIVDMGDKVSQTFGGIMTRNLTNMGLGTNGSTSTSYTERWDGLKVGMARTWNRVLTDEEIMANYNEITKRFSN